MATGVNPSNPLGATQETKSPQLPLVPELPFSALWEETKIPEEKPKDQVRRGWGVA